MNIFNCPNILDVVTPNDVLCITTNGAVRRDGACVMGRGIALQIAVRSPIIPFRIGELIRKYGNRCFNLHNHYGLRLATFVVKHSWEQDADLKLIAQSCTQITEMADKFEWTHVYIPAPGCGNGHRSWSEVEPIVRILDDRFTIVFKSKS